MVGSPWGGSELLWAESALRAISRGHNVTSMTCEWTPPPEPILRLVAAGASVLTYPRSQPPGLLKRIANRLKPAWFKRQSKVCKALATEKPDFVCVNQGSSYCFAGQADLKRLLNDAAIPYGVICHHSFEHMVLNGENERKVVFEYYRKAKWVAFVADGNRRKVSRELGRLIPNGIVVRNPVNLPDLSEVPWPSSDGPVRLACVARLEVAFKGHDLLFEVLSGDPWRGRDWRVRLYGVGPDSDYLRRVAELYNLDHRIEFVGHVSDIRSIWADNHVLLLPSRSEGTPISLVEAMICGRPSVVTDVGGMAEWISEPNTGFLAEAATSRSFGNALERAWAARFDWRSVGNRAHTEALSRIDRDPGGSLVDLIERGALANIRAETIGVD